MNRATAFNRALSLGGTLSLILLVLLAFAFQTTGTREAEAQTTVTKTLVDGSPWKWKSDSGVIRNVFLRFFSGKDGKFTATFNKRPTSGLKVDGKKVTLTGKKKNGKEIAFSLELNNEGNLSGSADTPAKGGWRTVNVVLKPAR